MKKITIHQSQFLPYMGFFNKVIHSNIYVVLDDVKATQADFTNRNKLRAPNGECYITIPVRDKNIKINEMMISDDNWVEKHIRTLQNFYTKTPYYESYIKDIIKIYKSKKWNKIIDIDMAFLNWLFKVLDITIEVIYSSSLDIDNTQTLRLVEICKALSGETYISGPGGKQYLNLSLFEKNNIKVVFQNFKHPIYQQKFKPFIPNLSILDALFNCGNEKVRKMILGGSNL